MRRPQIGRVAPRVRLPKRPRKGDYQGALQFALKINVPGYFYNHLALAAVYGQLGERTASSAAWPW